MAVGISTLEWLTDEKRVGAGHSIHGMQPGHCALYLIGQDFREPAQRFVHRLLDSLPIRGRWLAQHIIDHIVAMAGMANPQAQAIEIPTAQYRDDVSQTIVPPVATPLLEPDDAWFKIDFIVHHQYRLGRQTVEPRKCRY